MEAVYALTRLKNIELFLPESFEWLVLSSGLFDDTEMRKMLEHPADFIDSERFFSWESFFTDALIQKNEGHLSCLSQEGTQPRIPKGTRGKRH